MLIPKTSPLYTAPPVKIGESSPYDMAGVDYGINAFKSTQEPILATSQSSRAETAKNVNKLDQITQKYTGAYSPTNPGPNGEGTANYQNPSPYGIGADGKAIQDPNAIKEPTTVSQPLEAGNKWVYLSDGSRVQIPLKEDPSKYGASSSPKSGSTTYNPDGTPTKPVLTPDQQAIQDQSDAYKKDLEDGKAKLLANSAQYDATAQALIQSITASYDARMKKMEDINARYLEGTRISGISAGRSRYMPVIALGALQTEELDGQARLAELESQKLSLIVKAKQARDEMSIKSFNEYMNLVEEKNKATVDTITKLHEMSTAAENALIAKEKEERANKQSELNYQQDLATSYARGVYDKLSTFTTEEEKQAYIDKIAKDKNIDPEILSGAVQDYRDKEETQNSQIAQREQNVSLAEQRLALAMEKKENGGAGTASEKKADIFMGFQTMLSPEAQPAFVAKFKYGMIDEEGFFTPEGLTAMLQMAQQKGISRAEFLKEFSGYIGNDDDHKYKLTAAERKLLAKE